MDEWTKVLLDLEKHIAEVEAALDIGTEVPEHLLIPFAPPSDLPPLPESMRDRAVELLARQAELEQHLNTALETIGRELQSVAQGSGQGRRMSAFAETVIPRYFDEAL